MQVRDLKRLLRQFKDTDFIALDTAPPGSDFGHYTLRVRAEKLLSHDGPCLLFTVKPE